MKAKSNLRKTVKKFFAEFDMFSVPSTLRANQQPQTSSICSGVTSFLLACFFSYVFIINVVGIMTYTKIDSIQTESRLGFDQVSGNNIFFAVRVGYLPLQISTKYFDIGYFVVAEDGSNTTYKLSQCQPQQWQKLSQNYTKLYNDFNLQDFLCPSPNHNISLKKIFYAPNSQYVSIYVRPCNSFSNSLCQNLTNQQQFIENLKKIQGAIFTSIYFLDQGINPGSEQAVNYFLNTDPEFAFTTRRGVIATIELGSYKVETDLSIFPVEDFKYQNGNFVNTFRQTSIELTQSTDNYALIYITLNRKYVFVQRKVGKLDDMLSYAGGLFSIIVGFLSFFIVSFNKYRYELLVAQGIFHEDQQGNKIRQNDFTFFKYIKYSAFDWIGTLCCTNIKWNDCTLIQSTRQQANKQMDVTRLFRKIQSLEFAVAHIISQNQKDCLALLKPPSLGSIRKNRLILEYYNKVIDNKSSLNFQQYRISNKILKFGLSLLKNEQNQNPNGNRVNNESLTQENFHEQFEINYQDLKDIDYMISMIKKHFRQISQQSDEIQLDSDQQQVQIDLAQAYFTLNQEKKTQLLGRIPIKILYRLGKKYNLLKKYDGNEQKIKKKKRVALNIVQNSKIYDFRFNQSL